MADENTQAPVATLDLSQVPTALPIKQDLSELPDWAREQIEAGERARQDLSKTRREAAGYRARLREFETSEETARRKAEADAPLEERIKLLEQERDELAQQFESIEEAKEYQEALGGLAEELSELGVPKSVLNDATVLLAQTLEDMDEEELDNFDLKNWLDQRSHLTPSSTKESEEGRHPSTQPSVRLGSARNAQGVSSLSVKSIEEMSLDEYDAHRPEIKKALRQGTLR